MERPRGTRMGLAIRCAVIAALWAGAHSPAWAEAAPGEAAQPPIEQPRSGPARVGVAIGSSGGYVGGHSRNLQLDLPLVGLADLRLLAAVHARVTLDLWLPASWMLFQLAIGNPVFDVALMARVRPAARSRFYLAPGLEVSAWTPYQSSNYAVFVGVPLGIGYEWVNDARTFGTTLALRPAAGAVIARVGPSTSAGLGLGLVVELALGSHVEPPRRSSP